MSKRYTPNDALSQKAQKEGYRARSVYKLIELDEKQKLLKQGMHVLDLGAAPGSWLQYISAKIGSKGNAIGIDLQEIESIGENIDLIQADITDEKAMEPILEETFDLVLSDIAPATSGVKDVDQWRSIELAEIVFYIGKKTLKKNGKCVCKVFRGADFDEFVQTLKKDWKTVKTMTVKASRDRSREIYVLGVR